MNLLGIRLSVLMGKNVPMPPPPWVTEALEKVEITHKEGGCSGFQMVFKMGRGGMADLLDYPVSNSVKDGLRVIISVIFNGIPSVLSDGIITHTQLIPKNDPGMSRLCATGEDVTCAMGMEEKNVEHPAQSELIIANKIIASYADLGMVPEVIPPTFIDQPLPNKRTPVQRCTDRDFMRDMASRFGYDFYATPGPLPGMNKVYWGPKTRLGKPQPALVVNMGASTNVTQISFTNDKQKPVSVSVQVQDAETNKQLEIKALAFSRSPLSVGQPASASMRKVLLYPPGGLSASQATSYVQGLMDASYEDVLQATGELDTAKYNNILWPRRLVGLRGAGFRHDGLYRVKSVTHCIERGKYKQAFVLAREGLGSMFGTML